MRCQYSRRRPVSSEKRQTLTGAGAKEGSGHAAGSVNATVMGHYRAPPEPTEAMSCAVKATKALRCKTPARLYTCDAILEWLAQDLEDMAPELGQFIQEEHTIVG
jgi:hypothetical protein